MKPAKSNPIAKAIRTAAFRPRIIRNKKLYSRKGRSAA